MKTIYLDIMLAGYFYCQLKYQFCPLFPISAESLHNFVEEKRPSLHGKDYEVFLTSQRT